jgi:hypothetical protein
MKATIDLIVKETFETLESNKSSLSLSQIDLLNGFKKQFNRKKSLTDKQLSILFDLKKYLS